MGTLTANASRTERKKLETRQKIIDAAMELIRTQGFDAVTMEQIADAADVAKGTLYNYFPAKEAILAAFIQGRFQEKSAARLREIRRLPGTRARLRLVYGELLAGVRAQPEIFDRFLVYRTQNIISLHKSEAERGGIDPLAEEILRLGRQQGEIRGDLPSPMLEDLFEFAFIELVKQFSLAPETFDAPRAIEWSIDLFLRGAQA